MKEVKGQEVVVVENNEPAFEVVTNNESAFDVTPSKVEIVEDGTVAIFDPKNLNRFYTSIPQDGSRASKIKNFNAVTNTTAALDDVVGQVLEVEHVVAHQVQLANRESGEVFDAIRVILVTADGDSYSTASVPFYNAVQTLFSAGITAPFTPTLKIKVIKKASKANNNHKFLTFEVVE